MSRLKVPEVSDEAARQMLERAEAARANTYPTPGKGYVVSVLTDKGNIYEGVSYNSDTLTLTMHCEMTALAHAAIHGDHNIVAITGPNCHMCKQLIWESALRSGIDVQVVMEEAGEIRRVPISTLMLYPWPDEEGRH
jgi:cytidine deaminase